MSLQQNDDAFLAPRYPPVPQVPFKYQTTTVRDPNPFVHHDNFDPNPTYNYNSLQPVTSQVLTPPSLGTTTTRSPQTTLAHREVYRAPGP